MSGSYEPTNVTAHARPKRPIALTHQLADLLVSRCDVAIAPSDFGAVVLLQLASRQCFGAHRPALPANIVGHCVDPGRLGFLDEALPTVHAGVTGTGWLACAVLFFGDRH